MFFRVQVFQGPGPGSRVQGPGSGSSIQGPGPGSRIRVHGPGSGSRVRVHVLEVAYLNHVSAWVVSCKFAIYFQDGGF